MVSIGVIGHGFVGSAVATLECVGEVHIYDLFKDDYNSPAQRSRAYNADIVFVNVPTDLNSNDRLDACILFDCMKDYKLENKKENTLVIKSTIPVGLCIELRTVFEVDNVVFNPEFLSQRTAKQDFMFQKEIYLAGPVAHRTKVKNLYKKFFDFYRHSGYTFHESDIYADYELLKLARNSFYGLKVSYCNHLFNLCEKLGVDYESFRDNFARGEWVANQHTYVPGPDNKFGYGGKCLPKDSIELLNLCKKNDILFEMLEKSIDFNKIQRTKGEE